MDLFDAIANERAPVPDEVSHTLSEAGPVGIRNVRGLLDTCAAVAGTHEVVVTTMSVTSPPNDHGWVVAVCRCTSCHEGS